MSNYKTAFLSPVLVAVLAGYLPQAAAQNAEFLFTTDLSSDLVTLDEESARRFVNLTVGAYDGLVAQDGQITYRFSVLRIIGGGDSPNRATISSVGTFASGQAATGTNGQSITERFTLAATGTLNFTNDAIVVLQVSAQATGGSPGTISQNLALTITADDDPPVFTNFPFSFAYLEHNSNRVVSLRARVNDPEGANIRYIWAVNFTRWTQPFGGGQPIGGFIDSSGTRQIGTTSFGRSSATNVFPNNVLSVSRFMLDPEAEVRPSAAVHTNFLIRATDGTNEISRNVEMTIRADYDPPSNVEISVIDRNYEAPRTPLSGEGVLLLPEVGVLLEATALYDDGRPPPTPAGCGVFMPGSIPSFVPCDPAAPAITWFWSVVGVTARGGGSSAGLPTMAAVESGISSTSRSNPRITAPDHTSDYGFTLQARATDHAGTTVTGTQVFTVLAANMPPVVTASADVTAAGEGDRVVLTCSATDVPQAGRTDVGIRTNGYSWDVESSTAVSPRIFAISNLAIENPLTATATITDLPQRNADYVLVMSCFATDNGGAVGSDDVTISVTAAGGFAGPSNVDAGRAPEDPVTEGDTFRLAASADVITGSAFQATYTWAIDPEMSDVTDISELRGTSTNRRTPRFIAPNRGQNYRIALRLVGVTDQGGNEADPTAITGNPVVIPVIATNSPPTIQVAPSASPSVISESMASRDINLAVSAADEDDFADLTYTWSVESVYGGGAAAPVANMAGSFVNDDTATPGAIFRLNSEAMLLLISDYTIRFQVTIQDGSGATNEISAITMAVVTATNSPPTAEAGAAQTVSEGRPATLTGSGTDPDGNALAYSWAVVSRASATAAGLPTVAAIDSALANSGSRVATLTPPLHTADYTIVMRLTVADAAGMDADEVTITVRDNQAPTASLAASGAPTEGMPVTLTATTSDPTDFGASPGFGSGGSFLWEYTSSTAAPVLAVNEINLMNANMQVATIASLPDRLVGYNIMLRFTATDNDGASVMETLTVTVAADNDAPALAQPAAPSAIAESAAIREVTFTAMATDPETEQITYNWELASVSGGGNSPAKVTKDTVGSLAGSGVVTGASGVAAPIVFTLAAETELNLTEAMTVTFTVTARDATSVAAGSSGFTTPARMVALTISATNSPPVITPNSLTVMPNALAEDASGVAATLNLNGAATDPEQQPLTYAWQITGASLVRDDSASPITTLSQFGTITNAVTSTGVATFALASDLNLRLVENVRVTLELEASDGAGTDTETTTFTITANDDTPTAAIVPVTTALDEDGTMSTLLNTQLTDEDTSSLNYVWTVTAGADLGTLDSTTAATPTFTLNTGLTTGGSVTITLVVTDTGNNSSPAATTNLTVVANNDAPTFTITSTLDTINEQGANTTTLSATVMDSDTPDGSIAHTWSLLSATTGAATTLTRPANAAALDALGTFTVSTTGTGSAATTTFMAANNLLARHTLTFRLVVTDDATPANTVMANRVIILAADNDAPSVDVSGPSTVRETATGRFTATAVDSDDGLDPTSYAWTTATETTGAPDAVLVSGQGTAEAMYMAPDHTMDYRFTVSVTVRDMAGTMSAVASHSVDVTNNRPPTVTLVANANIMEGTEASLNVGFSDPDGDAITSLVLVHAANTAVPPFTSGEVQAINAEFTVGGATSLGRFTPPERTAPYTITIRATVTEARGATNEVTRTYDVAADDDDPVARIGASPGSITEAAAFSLDGSTSTDDGASLSYAWELTDGTNANPDVTMAELSAAGISTATATFTPPDRSVGYDLTFRLTVTDTDAPPNTHSATRTVSVSASNSLPTLSAASGPTAIGEEAATRQITLTATAADPENEAITYTWVVASVTGGGNSPSKATSANVGTFANSGSATGATGVATTITFTLAAASTLNLTEAMMVGFGVTARDATSVAASGPMTAQRTVSLRINGVNSPPMVPALTAPSSIAEDANPRVVTLSAAAATDPEGEAITYTWSITGITGGGAAFTRAHNAAPSGTGSFGANGDQVPGATLTLAAESVLDLTEAATLELTLTAMDATGASATAMTTLAVTANNDAVTLSSPNIVASPTTLAEDANTRVMTLTTTATDAESENYSAQWSLGTVMVGSSALTDGEKNAIGTFANGGIATNIVSGVAASGMFTLAPEADLDLVENMVIEFEVSVTTLDTSDTASGSLAGFIVTADNDAPTASTAGSETAGTENTAVNLTGAASTDPEEQSLTYAWAFKESSDNAVTAGDITIENATTAMARFTPADRPGNYSITLTLTVTDAGGATNSADAVVAVTASNSAPVAIAGTAREIPESQLAMVTGQAMDADHSTHTFMWDVVAVNSDDARSLPTRAEVLAATSNRNQAVLSITPPGHHANYTITLRLSVSDGTATDTDDIILTVQNTSAPPEITQAAAEPATAAEGAEVMLTGSAIAGTGSGTPIAIDASLYSWAFVRSVDAVPVVAANEVVLSSVSSRNVTIEALPDRGANYSLVMRFTAGDAEATLVTMEIMIVVQTTNDAPVADAGESRETPPIGEGTPFILDASASTDDGGAAALRYTWSVVRSQFSLGGSEPGTGDASVTLSELGVVDPSSPTVTFTAPERDAPYIMTLQLTVTDAGGLTDTDTIVVRVAADNDPPIITTAPSVLPTELMEDAASRALALTVAATDQDATVPLVYTWVVMGVAGGGPAAAVLADAGTFTGNADETPPATFTLAAEPALSLISDYTITFQVNISDGGSVSNGTVAFIVRADNDAPTVSAGSDRTVVEAMPTTLTATATDSDNPDFTYAWSVVSTGDSATAPTSSALTAALMNANMASATLTPPAHSEAYTVVMRVAVSDGASTVNAEITLTVQQNLPPMATASASATATEGDRVQLIGTAMDQIGAGDFGIDPSGYSWTFVSAANDVPPIRAGDIVIENANSANAAITALPDRGADYTLTMRFTATDNDGTTDSDDVTINVTTANDAPVAMATRSGAAAVTEGTAFMLNAGQSTDDGGDDALTFAWALTASTATPTVMMADLMSPDATANVATFNAPDRPASYSLTFTLTATDVSTGMGTATIVVNVTADNDGPTNVQVGMAPTTNVDGDALMEGDTFEVTVTAMDDGDATGGVGGITFTWMVDPSSTIDPPVTSIADLMPQNPGAANARFIAPNRTASYNLVLVLASVADSADAQATGLAGMRVTVSVTAVDDPPVATASTSETIVGAGAEIMLMADVEDVDTPLASIKYRWQVTPAGGVTSEIADTARTSYTAPAEAADLMFTFTATDNVDFTAPAPPAPANPRVTLRVIVTAETSGEIMLTDAAESDAGPIADVDTSMNTAPTGLMADTEALVVIDELPQPAAEEMRVDTMDYRLAVTYTEPATIPNPPQGIVFSDMPDGTGAVAVSIELEIGTTKLGDLADDITICLQPSPALLAIVDDLSRFNIYRRVGTAWETPPLMAATPKLRMVSGSSAQYVCATSVSTGDFALGVQSITIAKAGDQTREWFMRMGRIVAMQSVDVIARRGETLSREDASYIRAGSLNSAGGAANDPYAMYRDQLDMLHEDGILNSRTQSLGDLRVMARDLEFNLSAGAAGATGGGGLAFWGQVSHNQIKTSAAELAIDGKVTSFHIGADYNWGKGFLAGVAVAISEGSADIGTEADRATADTSLITTIPYAHVRIGDNFVGWVLAGFGQGDTDYRLMDSQVKIDSSITMFAAGTDISRPIADGIDLRVSNYYMEVSTELDPVTDDNGNVTAFRDAKITQARLAAGINAEWGRAFSTNFDLGYRFDGGDAETGSGFDLSLGVDIDVRRLTIAAKGRVLLEHSLPDYRDWGISLSASLNPSASGNGAAFSLRTLYGASTEQGTEQLWQANEQFTDGIVNAIAGQSGAEPRLEMAAGFGLNVGAAVMVPYTSVTTSLADQGVMNAIIGTRFQLKPAGGAPLELDFYIGRDARSFASNRVGVGIGVTVNR